MKRCRCCGRRCPYAVVFGMCGECVDEQFAFATMRHRTDRPSPLRRVGTLLRRILKHGDTR